MRHFLVCSGRELFKRTESKPSSCQVQHAVKDVRLQRDSDKNVAQECEHATQKAHKGDDPFA